jgi:hypothetical protein
MSITSWFYYALELWDLLKFLFNKKDLPKWVKSFFLALTVP